jgi:hypothetical protein
MILQFKELDHVFFTNKDAAGLYKIQPAAGCELHEIDDISEIVSKDEYLEMCQKAEKIIISGVFGICDMDGLHSLIEKKLLHKTYFHFWGGDFYCFRESPDSTKSFVRRFLLFHAFREAAGLIFLIDGEYEKFKTITGISNRHFVAPMPADPDDPIDFAALRNQFVKNDETVNIIVGNSSYPANHHEEVFYMLQHLANCNIRIYCPLSYGNAKYGETISGLGKKIFGDKFNPVFDFMDRDEYLKFLSKMDLGIFYNDRQQAMANINFLLTLGKKLFLRTTTSMWVKLSNQGFKLFDAAVLGNLTLEELTFFENKDQTNNILLGDTLFLPEKVRERWDTVFKSETGC